MICERTLQPHRNRRIETVCCLKSQKYCQLSYIIYSGINVRIFVVIIITFRPLRPLIFFRSLSIRSGLQVIPHYLISRARLFLFQRPCLGINKHYIPRHGHCLFLFIYSSIDIIRFIVNKTFRPSCPGPSSGICDPSKRQGISN